MRSIRGPDFDFVAEKNRFNCVSRQTARTLWLGTVAYKRRRFAQAICLIILTRQSFGSQRIGSLR
jgi:hypothetical protein